MIHTFYIFFTFLAFALLLTDFDIIIYMKVILRDLKGENFILSDVVAESFVDDKKCGIMVTTKDGAEQYFVKINIVDMVHRVGNCMNRDLLDLSFYPYKKIK